MVVICSSLLHSIQMNRCCVNGWTGEWSCKGFLLSLHVHRRAQQLGLKKMIPWSRINYTIRIHSLTRQSPFSCHYTRPNQVVVGLPATCVQILWSRERDWLGTWKFAFRHPRKPRVIFGGLWLCIYAHNGDTNTKSAYQGNSTYDTMLLGVFAVTGWGLQSLCNTGQQLFSKYIKRTSWGDPLPWSDNAFH